MTELERWLEESKGNSELQKLFKKMTKEEIDEAFSSNISFGTGGMRGVMGAGTNRMNIFTIRKANYGLGKYLLNNFKGDVSRGVVISHDNRNNSRLFAIESAKVLGALGIKTYMFDDLRTTPELSFSVRYLNAISGIMITASHNPKEYNGYKVYDEYGCQLTDEFANKVIEEVNNVTDVFSIPTVEINKLSEIGLYKILDKSIDDAFLEADKKVLIFKDIEKKIKVVYTPLHGTGAEIAKRALEESGFDATYVQKQMEHDSEFKTVALPNPEDPNAFKLAEELGKKVKAELLVATDPDADRVGIGVLHNNKYYYLTGNQTGSLLLYFRLSKEKELGTLPKKGKVFNTIVTSELGALIAKSFDMSVFSTLTGFKYIGEQARLIENTLYKYYFGYEESYGYLIKDHVRDKDSIQSLLAIVEMANYYLVSENRDLVDVLEEVYSKYGYFKEYTRNMYFEGSLGLQKMKNVTKYFRENEIKSLGGFSIINKEDYYLSKRINIQSGSTSKLTLPKSDVIKYFFDSIGWVVIRPSGTEPKLKVYYSIKADSLESANENILKIDAEIKSIIDKITE